MVVSSSSKSNISLDDLYSDEVMYGVSFQIYRGILGAKVYKDLHDAKWHTKSVAEIRVVIGEASRMLYLNADELVEVARRLKVIAKVLKSRNKSNELPF